MLIALDVDGVIADLHSTWYGRYNRDWDDDLTPERVTTWDVHPHVKPECGTAIYDYLRAPDLYAHVQPIEGAIEGVAALRQMGHEIVYATSCTDGMTDQKAAWLVRYGFTRSTRMLPDDMIIAEDKNLIDAYLLIDDRAEHVSRWVEEKRRPAILFSYPHNRWLRDAKHSLFWLSCQPVENWSQLVAFMARRYG